jgi:hypothetical protein
MNVQRTWDAAAAVAGAGAILLLLGLLVAPRAVAVSYLVAYTATIAIAIAMLLMIMIAHLSGAVWFVPLRRHAEAVVATLPALALLALPFVIAPRAFWPSRWGSGYPAAFAARSLLYSAVWIALATILRRTPERLGVASAAGIPAASLAMTFAAFDWMMPVSPGWSSSVYGLYYFAGGMVSALALLAVLAARRGREQGSPTREHYQALGRLTLAFVLLWGYLWYVQFLIIWIADIPREVTWYVVRLDGGYRVLGFALVWTGFVAPLLVLLFRAARGSKLVMSGLGLWLLAVHYADVYWLLVPAARRGWSISDAIWDVAALALIAGAAGAVGTRTPRTSPIPEDDALLAASLRYEAP